jgi:excisionase family DNA binding protein
MAEPLIVVTAEQLEAVVERAVARALAGVRPATSPADPALVDIDEASRLLGLSTSTVYKLAARCEIPSVKLGGRLLFKPADLASHAESRRRSPERVRALAKPE